MTWLHTWAGITLGWILYLMFVTGTAGYFDTEIDRWMQPELPPVSPVDTAHVAKTIVATLEQEAPKASRWYISLPADRNQPYPSVFWQGASVEDGARSASGSEMFDAHTGEILTPRDTGGGQTLYQMHWRLHYLSRKHSDKLIGIATLFMMVGLITGIVIHKNIFVDFFTLRLGKGRRSWLDAHNFLSVFALPFHLMITYSGLLFLGFSLMPYIVDSQYPDEGRRQFYAEVFDPPGLVDARGENAVLRPVEEFIAQAEQRWGRGRVQTLDIHNPSDADSRVVLYESISATVSTNAERLVFAGASGELLHVDPADASLIKHVRDVFLGLHEGLFASPLVRWIYFLSGLMGTGMVATGLILWASKRRQKNESKHSKPHKGLRLVETLNAATIVGVPLAVGTYFMANRLLPVAMDNRGQWEVHIFFLTWLATLAYACVRPRHRVWQEQLAIAACVYLSLPLLTALTTERALWHSVSSGDWVFAGVEFTLLTLGLCFTAAARQVGKVQLPSRPVKREKA
ncbi:PepSY-associated TM helix domain-containing protein [Gilvimarinus xylanilyticus]|uniref:PepSY domain-containing protein n=1 Tax=Gilvimarinus xylanilyticus TaxID=2944139 RepID=A0A9X2KVX8_9GAMM|nr:PepSY-associated TM helix domain-containing protein [Gilvimarinus xylanilyticus]MCP8898470.1 PepSY domain-containing protein [Gilvimarinus xylanilyticus]